MHDYGPVYPEIVTSLCLRNLKHLQQNGRSPLDCLKLTINYNWSNDLSILDATLGRKINA